MVMNVTQIIQNMQYMTKYMYTCDWWQKNDDHTYHFERKILFNFQWTYTCQKVTFEYDPNYATLKETKNMQ